MAQPSPYNRAFNFSEFQAGNPTTPLPAGSLDEELSRVKAVLDQIRTSIAQIQRDDFALANFSVGFDQLKPEVLVGVNPSTRWVTATNYVVRDTVIQTQKLYICDVSHVSGVFATDLAAGKWRELADFTVEPEASTVYYDPMESGAQSDDVQGAIDELFEAIDTVAVSTVFGRGGNVVATAGDYSANQVDFDAAGLAHTDAVHVQGAIEDHDAAIAVLAASKANVSHTHPTSEIVGFSAALAGKANVSHTHEVAQIAPWNLLAATNGDYTLIQKAIRVMTISSVVTQSASGTATFTFKINGVALGGSANAVSTTEQTQAHTTANVIPIGGKLTLTVSSNSSCQKAAIQVNFTETIP